MAKYTLTIEGMTCAHCEARVTQALSSVPGVGDLEVSLAKGTASFELGGGDGAVKDVVRAVEQAGYGAHAGKKFDWIYVWGFVLAVVLMMLSMRLVRGRSLEGADYGFIFIIGLLTSLHCVAMCGGITLSQVAGGQSFSERALTLGKYHLARLFSYSIVGAVLGGIGAFATPSNGLKGLLVVAGGIGMALFALAGIAPRWFSKVRLPGFLSGTDPASRYGGNSSWVLGFLNGFVPCPPLQAMQLFALASGSALRGGLSMMFFALGTIPLLLGFGTFVTLLSPRWRSRLVKLGLMFVLLLALIMVVKGTGMVLKG